jgi:type IV pilus assembly protein PilO
MTARPNDRLWLFGGVLVIVALVAAGFLLVIKPVYEDQRGDRASIRDAERQLIGLQKDLAGLKRKSSDLAAYNAQLATKRKALPVSYDVPNFVRQLQDSGTAVQTDVSGFTFGLPSQVTGAPSVIGIPITLTATGTPANLSRFFDRLQNVQSRAVLISSVGLSQGDSSGDMTANLTLTAYCSAGPKCKTPTK